MEQPHHQATIRNEVGWRGRQVGGAVGSLRADAAVPSHFRVAKHARPPPSEGELLGPEGRESNK